MPINFMRGAVSFDPTQGQIQTQFGTVVFPSRVLRAEVAVSAFDVKYTHTDHEFFHQIINARTERVEDRTVTFRVDFLLRDSSGNIDDVFQGRVEVLVIVDAE